MGPLGLKPSTLPLSHCAPITTCDNGVDRTLKDLNSGCTLFVKVKDFQTKKYNFFFLNYYLTPLDIYTGLSQVYCIKPEGRIISIQRVNLKGPANVIL